MKKSLVLAMAMALGVTASAYAANPFSDVPAGHWAYDSVAKLAAAGVVDGYADGAFDGDKLMTRYEMAQIVAKAMAKGADCDKLAAEFADELDTLGVRVAKLEKGADAVKITGETRLRYWNFNDDGKAAGKNGSNGDQTQLRTRIWIKGQVNEDWTATAMLENVQKFDGSEVGDEGTNFQRAYVNGKVGGLKVQAGRYSWLDATGGLIYDDRMDGIQVSYGKDVKLTAGYGKGSDASSGDRRNAEDMAYVEAATKLGVVEVKAGYYKFDNVMYDPDAKYQKAVDADKDGKQDKWDCGAPGKTEEAKYAYGDDVEIYAITAGLPLAKDLKFAATYLINESEAAAEDAYVESGDDGFVLALNYKKASAAKPGSWGVWAKYYDQPAGTFVAPTFEADDAGADNKFYADMKDGFKGYGVGVDYAIAKNIVAQVKYYDLEAQEGENEREVLYGQVNFSF